MLCWGSWRIMKWRQLFWIAFCVVELSGKVSGNPTTTSSPTTTATRSSSSSSAAAPALPSSAQPALKTPAAAGSSAASPTSAVLSSERPSSEPSRAPTQPPSTSSGADHTSQGVNTTERPVTPLSTTAEAPGSASSLRSSPAASEHPHLSAATTSLPSAEDSPKSITCHNVREVSDTGAICLQLNESSTCKHFLETKGSDLWSAICEQSTHRVPHPCQIKLAKSEVDRDCMLLILVGERDPATDVLQESHWEKLGIKSLKQGSVRNHQDFSQKTLIALVTSGLMLAFLGLAGYFLMKRRSWSPAGERLAEDPYYTENGSQGNTMLMTPSQEQAEPQEKPNLNGGTQENGTGQASSKNGHSGRQQSPADTEM